MSPGQHKYSEGMCCSFFWNVFSLGTPQCLWLSYSWDKHRATPCKAKAPATWPRKEQGWFAEVSEGPLAADLSPFFINFSCTNVSQNLLMPTFLHQFMLNGPCPQPHPRPHLWSGSAGLGGLSVPLHPCLLLCTHCALLAAWVAQSGEWTF